MRPKMLRFFCSAATILGLTYAHGQQDKWFIPPNFYDMSTATPTPATASSSYNSASQSVFSNSGTLLFYINDKMVYSANGTYAFDLPGWQYANGSIAAINPKIIAVPVPEVCNKYYVFYSMFGGGLAVSSSFAIIVDMTSGSPVIDPSSLHPAIQDGGLSGTNPMRIGEYGTFTVSKTTSSSNQRYLFAFKPRSLQKYLITSTGLIDIGTIYSLPLGTNYNPPNIELSPNQQYLTFSPGYGDNRLLQIQLDGSFNTVATSEVNFPNPLTGIQYDATSTNLFVSTNGGIQWHTAANLTTGAFATIPGSSSLGATVLELGKTGNIYGVNSLSNRLCYFSPSALPSPTITTTNIGITQNYTYFPIGSMYSLPAQIDGQDYHDFGGRPLPRTDFSLAGATANAASTPATATNAYTCNDILFGNISRPGPYLLMVQSCDPNGIVVSGSSYLNYSSGYRPYTSGFIDFKSLPSIGAPAQETWLADPTHFGYYKVTLYTQNLCGEVSAPKTSYLKLNAPPSAASINFQINNGVTGVPCNNKNIAMACPTGVFSGSYNIGAPGTSFASNNIASYTRKIEEVDCTTGTILNILYEDAAPVVPANPNGASTALGLNAITINGSPGYFATNPVFGKCYKFTLTAYNACSNASDWSYLKFDGFYKPGRNNTGTDNINESKYALCIYPNPAQDQLKFNFTLKEGKSIRLTIYDIQGKLLIDGKETDGTEGINNRQIDISQLSPGMYVYKLTIGTEIITGKVTKM